MLASRWLLLLVTIAAVIVACGDDLPDSEDGIGRAFRPSGVVSCAPGREGCSCTEPGRVVACGKVVKESGSYVTCSMGHSTCEGGRWGECLGDRIAVRSVQGLSLDGAGLRPLSIVAACTNVCDPNECTQLADDATTVDASGLAPRDGGLGLVADAAPGCANPGTLACNVKTCAPGSPTKIVGTVYDPAGENPLYGIDVYVPSQHAAAEPLGKLPAFTPGASKEACSGAGTVSAIAAARTDASGNFVLEGVPSGSGVKVPIVLQTGKWRREIVLTDVRDCTTNALPSAGGALACDAVIPAAASGKPANCMFRLPRNQSDGYGWSTGAYDHADMPHVAFVSGDADPLDCLLLKIGIDDAEFGSATVNASRKFHYFHSPDAPGNKLNATRAPIHGAQLSGDKLWNQSTVGATKISLAEYDAVLLPCEGRAVDKMGTKPGVPVTTAKPPTGVNPYANLIAYANGGGRVFATHFSYVWLQYPDQFKYVANDNWGNVATWAHPYNAAASTMNTSSYATQDPLTASVVQNFTKGSAFAAWLVNVGASSALGSFPIHQGRHDDVGIGASTLAWMTANDTRTGISPSSFVPHFTFEAPYAATDTYGRVLFSDFHVTTDALATSDAFPFACRRAPMTAQEKALEFMFFDLTSCVGPSETKPASIYSPASFVQDYAATCRPGFSVLWRELDWQASVPSTSSIVFEAQTGPSKSSMRPPVPLPLATASVDSPSAPGAYDVVIIDDSNGANGIGNGKFNKAVPPLRSESLLRVKITLNPTTDRLATPLLRSWKVQYDCVPTQ